MRSAPTAVEDSESDSEPAAPAARAKAQVASKQAASMQDSDSESDNTRPPPKEQLARKGAAAQDDSESGSELAANIDPKALASLALKHAAPNTSAKVQAAHKPVVDDSDSDAESSAMAAKSQPAVKTQRAAKPDFNGKAEPASVQAQKPSAAATKEVAQRSTKDAKDSDSDLVPERPVCKTTSKAQSATKHDSRREVEPAVAAPESEAARKLRKAAAKASDSDSEPRAASKVKVAAVQDSIENHHKAEVTKPSPKVQLAHKPAAKYDDSDSESVSGRPTRKDGAALKESATGTDGSASVGAKKKVARQQAIADDSDSDSVPSKPAPEAVSGTGKKQRIASTPDPLSKADVKRPNPKAPATHKQGRVESDSDSASEIAKPSPKVRKPSAPTGDPSSTHENTKVASKASKTHSGTDSGRVPKERPPSKQKVAESGSRQSDNEEEAPKEASIVTATAKKPVEDSSSEEPARASKSKTVTASTAKAMKMDEVLKEATSTGTGSGGSKRARPGPARSLPMESESDEDKPEKQRLPSQKAPLAKRSSNTGASRAGEDISHDGEKVAPKQKGAARTDKAQDADRDERKEDGGKDSAKVPTSAPHGGLPGCSAIPLRVHVAGLPTSDMDAERLRNDFADCGEIEDVWLPLKSNGRSPGFGQITFKDQSGVEAALRRSGDTKCYPGLTLKVCLAKNGIASPVTSSSSSEVLDMETLSKLAHAQAMCDFSALEALAAQIKKRARAAQGLPDFTVAVTGLQFKHFDLEAFRSVFFGCGQLGHTMDFTIPLKANGRTKGVCSIKFKTWEAFQKALSRDGTEHAGRILVIRDASSAASAVKDESADVEGTRKDKKKDSLEFGARKRDVGSSAGSDENFQTPDKTFKAKGAALGNNNESEPPARRQREPATEPPTDATSIKHKRERAKRTDEALEVTPAKKAKKDAARTM